MFRARHEISLDFHRDSTGLVAARRRWSRLGFTAVWHASSDSAKCHVGGLLPGLPLSENIVRKWLIYQAAVDFFLLQNRRYPRRAALEWVGNRYQLEHLERQILHRGIFSQPPVLRRRSKRCMGSDWQQEKLVVDGHNVQITVESAILQRPLLLANDGALRDVAGQSAGFRFSWASMQAVLAILRLMAEFRPREVLFLFDAPMSHSGLLAQHYRQQLKALGIVGDARTVPVPEREFSYADAVVASSDHAVLDVALHWLDLARWVIDYAGLGKPLVDFTRFALAAQGERNLAAMPWWERIPLVKKN
jgi:hypothetical protein